MLQQVNSRRRQQRCEVLLRAYDGVLDAAMLGLVGVVMDALHQILPRRCAWRWVDTGVCELLETWPLQLLAE